jgi:hypothetical protein
MKTLLYLLLIILNAFMLGVSLTENSYAIKNVEGYKFWLYGFFIIYFSVALIVHLKNPDQES